MHGFYGVIVSCGKQDECRSGGVVHLLLVQIALSAAAEVSCISVRLRGGGRA